MGFGAGRVRVLWDINKEFMSYLLLVLGNYLKFVMPWDS